MKLKIKVACGTWKRRFGVASEAPGGRDSLSITVSWGISGDWEMPGEASQKKLLPK